MGGAHRRDLASDESRGGDVALPRRIDEEPFYAYWERLRAFILQEQELIDDSTELVRQGREDRTAQIEATSSAAAAQSYETEVLLDRLDRLREAIVKGPTIASVRLVSSLMPGERVAAPEPFPPAAVTSMLGRLDRIIDNLDQLL